jgi:hypothetical protein
MSKDNSKAHVLLSTLAVIQDTPVAGFAMYRSTETVSTYASNSDRNFAGADPHSKRRPEAGRRRD